MRNEWSILKNDTPNKGDPFEKRIETIPCKDEDDIQDKNV